MRIFVYPSDLVKYCIWDHFVYYIINSEKEAEKLLKEDKELEISEKDALVMGLFKIIKTDNLIHRFNDYLVNFLSSRSIKEKTDLLIKKKTLESSIQKFLDKFPEYWKPPVNYANSLKELKKYIDAFSSDLKELNIINVNILNVSYEFYSSNSVKKLLNFNFY